MWFIYQITNRKNGKKYIGKTDNIERRWYEHCYNSKHGCKFFFHRAIRKYGETAFDIAILETYNDEQIALNREQVIIKELNTRNSQVGYNIAEGGIGGNTMTQEQLDAQYSIKSRDYEKFIELFNSNLTQGEIAKFFNVKVSGVVNCARRLGLSFGLRRSINSLIKRQKPIVRCKKLYQKRKITPEYSAFRANVMTRVNKARGISDKMKQQVVDMYFGPDELSAKEIAKRLEIGHGSVRCTISCAYAKMTAEERNNVKKKRASSVRSGDKNANSRFRRQII